MPNQPKTPNHTYRADKDYVREVRERAEQYGDTLTDIILRAYDQYMRTHPPYPEAKPVPEADPDKD